MKAKWEEIESDLEPMFRLNVPGGWLVAIYAVRLPENYSGEGSRNLALVFYPNPKHKWKP